MSELSQLRPSGRGRFHPSEDWFVHGVEQEIHRVVIGTNAERVLDTLHALCLHLDPAVDIALRDQRTARRWDGYVLPLPEVREAVGRLRLPIASYGGVELSLFTGDDQLSLTPELLLVIYARTDRWTFLLEEIGFVAREVMPPPTWRLADQALRPAPALHDALEAVATRLGLHVVPA
jgi:hypothetical protein